MMLALTVAAPRGCDASAFLAALSAEGVFSAPDVEVHIAQDAEQPVGASLPGVVIVTARPGSSIFELWGLAIRSATAPYIALLDARCPIAPGWLAAMRARLVDNPAALFGPVECDWSSSSPHVVGYLVEYAQFHPPLSLRLRETPGLNLVARRQDAANGAVLQDDGFIKTRLLAHLEAIAATPLAVEAAAVSYRKAFEFGSYCAHRFNHGRCYGADRAFKGGGARIGAGIVAPALPALRTWRIYRAAKDARLQAAFWRWLHRIVIAETAWSAGEFLGSLAGAGASRQRLR